MDKQNVDRSWWLREFAPKYGWLVLILVSALAGRILYRPLPSDPPGRSIADNPVVKSYTQAVSTIQNNHFKTNEWAVLTRTAIDRMLHSLDPHSNFHDRRQFAEMQNEQNSRYYGIGATINQRGNGIYVVGVTPGMPADRAGIRYGDAIVKVDGQLTRAWSQSEVLASVRGARGTLVEITVERVGRTGYLTYEIERDEIPYLSVRNFFMLRSDTGYVDLTGGFSQETSSELREAISELKSQGMERLLIDLRNNPGGLLMQAIQASEIFLPADSVIVSVFGREGKAVQRSYTSSNQNPESLPLALLVDEGTASAAEIMAGALQDNGRACIVGEESFGKGLVQTVFRLHGGTALSLTTARYLTPKGRSIHRSFAVGGMYSYGLSRRDQGAANDPASVTSGGGGITPDLPDKPGRGEITADEGLRLRNAAFQFVRQVSAGLVPGLDDWGARRFETSIRTRGPGPRLNGQLVPAFQAFVRDHPEWLISEPLASPLRDYIDLHIKAEMIGASSGFEAADRYLLDHDRQVVRALDWLSKRQLP